MGEPDWKGWWQDSDGKWHAPHEKPPPPVTMATGPFPTAPERNRKPWVWLVVVGVIVGGMAAYAHAHRNDGQDVGEARPATSGPRVASKSNKSARDWIGAAAPYLQPYADANSELHDASSSYDLNRVKTAAAHLADTGRSFRLALEAAGPPPSPISVEGRALIEATRTLETESRIVASCVSMADCTPKLYALATAIDSHTSAMSGVTDRLNGK